MVHFTQMKLNLITLDKCYGRRQIIRLKKIETFHHYSIKNQLSNSPKIKNRILRRIYNKIARCMVRIKKNLKKKMKKLRLFKKLLVKYISHQFQTQIEQYIASYSKDQIVKNTPDEIEKRLKEFFPDIIPLFESIESQL